MTPKRSRINKIDEKTLIPLATRLSVDVNFNFNAINKRPKLRYATEKSKAR